MLNIDRIIERLFYGEEDYYTVVYTCARGYRSFRQVLATSEEEAMELVRNLPPRNVGIVLNAFKTN